MPTHTHPIIPHFLSLLTDAYTALLPNECLPFGERPDDAGDRVMNEMETIDDWPMDDSPEVPAAKMLVDIFGSRVAHEGEDNAVDFARQMNLLRLMMPQSLKDAISTLPADVQALYYSSVMGAPPSQRLAPCNPGHFQGAYI